MRHLKYIIAVAFLAAAIFLFSGCTNSIKDIEEVSEEEIELPLNVQKNIVYEYSDSSFKRLEITAPEVLDFSNSEKPFMEFPQGIVVTFFNKLGKPESSLRANYAKRFVEDQKWEARGDVVVINEKGEKLNTEHLIWETQKEIIYSNVFTKITVGEEVLMGDGFEADQNFTSYKLLGNIKGELQLEENTLEDENAENS